MPTKLAPWLSVSSGLIKPLEAHGRVLGIVATDDPVLTHQSTSTRNSDQIINVLDQFHTYGEQYLEI